MSKNTLENLNLKIKELEFEVAQLKNNNQTPIAVIGMGCRFPGGADEPNAFWNLLSQGYCAVRETPNDRWDVDKFYSEDAVKPGTMYTKYGAFLNNVDSFDPEFFSITPREAERMDPQQRLFLEVAWEALECAGQPAENLFESRTGVFLGISSHDYVAYYLNNGMQHIDAYYGTGTQFSLAVGRLSYWLGLQGPSLVIDTACSSSLVGLHVACQSLRNRECEMAIAGGVHMMLSPALTIYCSKANMISRDGKCKTFDVTADGYGRGEGCGVVVLKRLEDAQSNKDNILAIIRGSVVNQDGKSAGITAPNRLAQEKLLKEGLEKYFVKPEDVSYLECHGTGTPLGDPIELNSVKTIFEEAHAKDNPLYIGSVKTNISHLEAAAGIAGVIKVILSMNHKKIPPHVNFNQLNSYININKDSFRINTNLENWELDNKKKIAGVSSFGFSGTNAFALLEEAPIQQTIKQMDDGYPREYDILTISAKSAEALRAYVEKYMHFLKNTEESFLDICYTANVARSIFPHRLAVVAKDKQDCYNKLSNFLSETINNNIFHGIVRKVDIPKKIFYFPGNIRLANDSLQSHVKILYEKNPLIKNKFDSLDILMKKQSNLSLSNIIFNSSQKKEQYNIILNFVLEYLLAELWLSYGIEPDIIAADGIGVCVAACITRLWTLEDTTKILSHLVSSSVKSNEQVTPINILKNLQYNEPSTEIINALTGAIMGKTEICEYRDLGREINYSLNDKKGLDILLDNNKKLLFINFGTENETLDSRENMRWLHNITRGKEEWENFLMNISKMYTYGYSVNWFELFKSCNVHKKVLPTYPFQRRKLWADFGDLS